MFSNSVSSTLVVRQVKFPLLCYFIKEIHMIKLFRIQMGKIFQSKIGDLGFQF